MLRLRLPIELLAISTLSLTDEVHTPRRKKLGILEPGKPTAVAWKIESEPPEADTRA